MTPLVVKARLLEGFVSRHPIHLDALLTAAYAMREGLLVPPITAEQAKPLPIPVQRSACGRFWLASIGEYAELASELRYKNRRAPFVEFARLGEQKIRRVAVNFGPNKSYRVPYEFTIPAGGTIVWHCIGEREPLLDLLRCCHYLGKFRGSGKGRVAQWTVEPCESWGDGFPVMRDGTPLRNIPVQEGAVGALLRCEPPYWLNDGRVPCLSP